MRRIARWVFLPLLFVVLGGVVGLNSANTPSANNAFFSTWSALRVYLGRSDRPTYMASATGLVTTAAYSMQLEAEVSRGFHLARVCVGTSNATAAALQTLTIRRTTAAGSGGTVLTAEGTAAVGISQMVPGTGNWGGRSVHTGTAGTAGALIDSQGWMVGELAAGTADPPGQGVQCWDYGLSGAQMPYVASGVANGITINVTAAGAGALASGSISAVIIAE